jgi:tellurite methyltransferase
MIKDKWNRIYQNKPGTGNPCSGLSCFDYLLPREGRALDLACGLGANSLFLARRGLNVEAWDNSPVALKRLRSDAEKEGLEHSVSCRLVDIEKYPPEPDSYDVIVTSCFLYRPVCGAIEKALKSNGILVYQTFHRNRLSDTGPTNPNFQLKENELLTLFPNLKARIYIENYRAGDMTVGDRDTALLIAQRC